MNARRRALEPVASLFFPPIKASANTWSASSRNFPRSSTPRSPLAALFPPLLNLLIAIVIAALVGRHARIHAPRCSHYRGLLVSNKQNSPVRAIVICAKCALTRWRIFTRVHGSRPLRILLAEEQTNNKTFRRNVKISGQTWRK